MGRAAACAASKYHGKRGAWWEASIPCVRSAWAASNIAGFFPECGVGQWVYHAEFEQEASISRGSEYSVMQVAWGASSDELRERGVAWAAIGYIGYRKQVAQVQASL